MSFVLDLNNIKPISLNDLDENNQQDQSINLKNQENIDSNFNIETSENNKTKEKHGELNVETLKHQEQNLQKEITQETNNKNQIENDNQIIKEKKNRKIKEKISISKNEQKKEDKIEINEQENLDLLLSIKEVETLSGISKVSIRKAIKQKEINYSLDNGKYRISFKELLTWCYSSTRRKNTFNSIGIGKYVSSWKITIE